VYTFLIVIEIIVAVLLTLVVLMQASKGGGLAGGLGSSQMGMAFGVRRASDFLGNITQWLAGIFLVMALVINLWFLPRGTEERISVIQTVPAAGSVPPSSNAPANPQ